MVHVVIDANRSQEKGKISSLGSQRKKDITAVLEETGKEIMNQAQTNGTIGQGLETNVSKVKQKLMKQKLSSRSTRS